MKNYTVFVVSDGTGETAVTMVRAALVQYNDRDVSLVRQKNIRQDSQLQIVVDEAFERQALIVFTLASPFLRKNIFEKASSKGVPCIDLLGPVLDSLDVYLDKANTSHTTGLLRVVDDNYYKRIEAIEYTVRHDDGKTFNQLHLADIILVGISRTSKTPLSIFLSHKGWKVANIPLVLGVPLPPELEKVDQRRVVGLMIDIESLQRIRKNRLERLGQDSGSDYASLGQIHKEIEYAHEIFKAHRKWPVFNVTERALEETATEIVKVVGSRLGWPDSVLF